MAKKPGWAIIAPEELKKIEKNKVEVKCAFCKGTGKDPFGLLSPLSKCQVCGGSGKVKTEGPVVKCKFCGGSGVQPYTTDKLHCEACGGKGVVTKISPSKECPTCRGTGLYLAEYRQPCLICKGQGVVAK